MSQVEYHHTAMDILRFLHIFLVGMIPETLIDIAVGTTTRASLASFFILAREFFLSYSIYIYDV